MFKSLSSQTFISILCIIIIIYLYTLKLIFQGGAHMIPRTGQLHGTDCFYIFPANKGMVALASWNWNLSLCIGSLRSKSIYGSSMAIGPWGVCLYVIQGKVALLGSTSNCYI